ncbi:MAG: hypothetical protein WKG03_07210 [Telluria sp.]
MVQPIGVAGAAGIVAGSVPAFASQQAQLQRYQKQLSECINCASASTSKGKAEIDAISARIGEVKARIALGEPTPRARAPDGVGGTIDVYA